MSAQLEIRKVAAGYNRAHPVLKDVSLQLERGRFIGLVGPNGSGKSTLVRTASRGVKPLRGRVLLAGKDIWSYSARDFARRVAVVPQEISVPFDLSCLEIVLLGRHPHVGRLHLETVEDESVALSALDVVGVLPLASRSIREVSGGERQRVMIAKALAQVPEVLLLDEPTAHLDVAQQTAILSLVADLSRERGIAVLAVLHDLNLAATWCEQIAVMDSGRIVEQGAPQDVVTESLLAKVWQARMWVRRNPMTGRPYMLPMPPLFEPDRSDEGAPTVHVVCGGGSGGPVLTMLMSEGYRVTCGVVNIGDSDEELCRAMNIPHVAEAPFSPISPPRAAANLKMALDADAIVLTDFCLGPGNVDNLRVVMEALKDYKRVISLKSSDSDSGAETAQDYTDGQGSQWLAAIREQAQVVSNPPAVLDALRAQLGRN